MPLLKNLKWCASFNRKRNKAYAVSRIGGKLVSMHRFLMNPPKAMQVDHINGNTLDNRRANLRICTNAENNSNKSKHRDNRSGFKGVYYFSWGNRKNRWCARLSHLGKNTHIGYFKTKKEAAIAYDKFAKKIHGEFASTNF